MKQMLPDLWYVHCSVRYLGFFLRLSKEKRIRTSRSYSADCLFRCPSMVLSSYYTTHTTKQVLPMKLYFYFRLGKIKPRAPSVPSRLQSERSSRKYSLSSISQRSFFFSQSNQKCLLPLGILSYPFPNPPPLLLLAPNFPRSLDFSNSFVCPNSFP